MNTATKTRPPRFSHYVDVDVDIDPEDLESAGWVYVGKSSTEKGSPPSTEHVLDAVRRWHDDTHPDAWINCRHDLCAELAR